MLRVKVVDCYNRDRVRRKNTMKQSLEIYQWTPMNPFMKKLKSENPMIHNKLEGAMKSYCKRYELCSTLHDECFFAI